MNTVIAYTLLFGIKSTFGQFTSTITGPEIVCAIDKDTCGPNGVITGIDTETLLCMRGQCNGTTFDITTPGESFKFEAIEYGFLAGTLNVADNVVEIDCQGELACIESTFNIHCSDINGCEIVCDGMNSCYYTMWDVTNVSKITCTGMGFCVGECPPFESSMACYDTSFDIDTIYQGIAEIKCDGAISCDGTSWDYLLVGDNEIKMEAKGWYAGTYMVFNFIAKEGTPTLKFDLYCASPGDCPSTESACYSCGPISVNAPNVTVQCTVYCEENACIGIPTECIVEGFPSAPMPVAFKNKKFEFNAQTTVIIVLSTIITLLLVIIGVLVYCYKNNKMKSEVTFEPQIDENEQNDSNNNTPVDTNEAQAEITMDTVR